MARTSSSWPWRWARLEELVDVGFAVADGDETAVRAVPGGLLDGGQGPQPLGALLVGDRLGLALLLDAELGGVAPPALDVEQAERQAVGAERHGVVQQQALGPLA